MKILIGEVWKNIPIEYWEAAKVIDESFITAPKKIRLSNEERFLLAEMAWRITPARPAIILEYLKDMSPVGVEIQVNRYGDGRCVINYVSESGIKAQVVVPNTFRHVGTPISYNNVNWIKA